MKKALQKNIHLAIPYLLNPEHKITINLVGAGGTGSQVLSALCRIHSGLQALGHTGIHVRLFDDDIITDANIGRQLYSPADIGINKAISSISRINRYFGFEWEAMPKRFIMGEEPLNITITCVDTALARLTINQVLQQPHDGIYTEPFNKRLYWLDFGNSRYSGQVVLGTTNEKENNSLPNITDLFDLTEIKEEDQGPSCSLAEAIGRQDLFINSTLANLGCNLLWKLFTDGKLNYHGVYLNLETMQVRPIMVPERKESAIKKPIKKTKI